MEFEKYQHVERLGTDDVEGIIDGTCYIFPKIDGTNASVWAKDGQPQFGSRRRHLTVEDDNHGFAKAMTESEIDWDMFFAQYPNLRLYGEWLVPHSLKTYRKDAWRKFYVFDVMELRGDCWEYLPYDQYKFILEAYDIDYIPCMAVMPTPNEDNIRKVMEQNTFLIEDGHGVGEGIVIKNYNYTNKYGRIVWAKVVTNEFKEKNNRAMGPSTIESKRRIEHDIVNTLCTDEVIGKVVAKVTIENDGNWNIKLIPKLLGMVYHDFVSENAWEIVKRYKNPTIDYKLLQRLVTAQVKESFSVLF